MPARPAPRRADLPAGRACAYHPLPAPEPRVRGAFTRVEGEAAETDLVTTFMAHREALARFLRLRSGSDTVDDLLQELWLRARASDQSDQIVGKPLAYLYRMAHSLVIDTQRGASRARSRDHDWGYVHDRLGDGEEPAHAERRLIARDELRTIDAALESVGQRAASIFRRYRLDGIDQRSIAGEMGVSISTVEKDLRKIYDALLQVRERGIEE